MSEASSSRSLTASAPATLDLKSLFPPLGRYLPDLPELPSLDQALFLLLDCREAFYGGSAGGGKSAALLMAALQYVDVPGYHALLLRRTFPELEGADGLISQSHAWLGRFKGEVVWNEQKHRWTFPSGATIEFGHCQDEKDKYTFQGQAFQMVGFDELTHFSETQYEYIGFTRARRTRDVPVPIRTRGASNPGGIGHSWVKSRFISGRKPGVVFVPAKAKDNPGLDVEEYWEGMKDLPEDLRRQLWDGDWDAHEGAAYQLSADHLVGRFEIPEQWERFESMDYGLNNPTSWLAHAIDYEGNLVSFGSYHEPGLPSKTAPIILKLRQLWRTDFCWGDPMSLATRTGTMKLGQPATIASEFADQGLPIARAKNDPRVGHTRMRELLERDPERSFPDWHPRRGQKGAPRWFIVAAACPELVEDLKAAPLTSIEHRFHGEMVDPKWEGRHGHAHAAARYGIASRFDPSEEPVEPEELSPQEQRDTYWRRRLEQMEKREEGALLDV